MPLNDAVCKSAKPTEKPRKLADEKGLYLEVMPTGAKYWRMKYRFLGKENRLALGVYPEISLKEAREKRDAARKQLEEGIDPSKEKKRKKLAQQAEATNGFETIAREWYAGKIGGWTGSHALKVIKRLEADIFPALGVRPAHQITAPELLAVLRGIEERGALDIAKRALQTCGQIFRYAIATGRAERDIAADLRGALKTRKPVNHARLNAKELPEFLQKLSVYDGDPQTRLALRLLILTFVRTTELRGAKWEEIDLEKAEWRIPAERMKMRDPHIVPLSRQALAVLAELRPLTGHSEHVFPNANKPKEYISENTMLFAMYRMGYHSRATPHGFRATASTILNERGFAADVIERQLAHTERNKVRAAYNHAQHLPERREMMQWWGDYLEATEKPTASEQ
ncbi:MAG: integrase arm-type DNA-binding domain-containing protein [Rickettsiales bacterium]